jgi:DNA mismatch repair protein MSH6
LLISTTVYRRGRFSFLDSCFSQKRNLYLDSQALESLEIFEVNLQTKVTNKGSLFDYLDKCATPYGKRLLTKWV